MKLKEYNFQSIIEEKNQGILRVYESSAMPFVVKRVFTIVNAQKNSKRGMHAHKKCNQLLCCTSGKIKLICDNGLQRVEKILTPNNNGILVKSGIWAEQIYLMDNSVLIVFCDQPYDEKDYIRDYNQFLNLKKNNE